MQSSQLNTLMTMETASSVRMWMYGDDFLLTGFTERSLELAIMRLYDVMESLQSEHLNQSDE